MNQTEKHIALEKWRTMWHAYISELKDEACSRDFVKEALNESRYLNFTRVLPSYAHNGSRVTIYEDIFNSLTLNLLNFFLDFKLKHIRFTSMEQTLREEFVME